MILSLLAIASAALPSVATAQGSRPLPIERCRDLSGEFARAIGRRPTITVAEPGAAKLPYADNIPGGRACVFTAEAKGSKAAARAGDALASLVIRLQEQGWESDDGISAEGGDDAQTGMRKGSQRFAFTIARRPGSSGWVFRAAAYER